MSRLTIGFLGIADFRSLRWSEVLEGIRQAAQDLDVELIVLCSAIRYSVLSDVGSRDHLKQYLPFCHRQNLDGLVTWASSFQELMPDQEILDLHQSLGDLPTMAIGVPLLPGVPGVYSSAQAGLEGILDHLVHHHGVTRLAYLGPLRHPHHHRRVGLFRRVVEDKFGLGRCPILPLGSVDRNSVRSALDLLFSDPTHQKERVQAIVTDSDLVASWVVELVPEYGLRVPEDVAVTGFNNQAGSLEAPVPITTVDFDFFGKSYEAVRQLVAHIEALQAGHVPAASVPEWPARLVLRRSCGCPGFPSPEEGHPVGKGNFPMQDYRLMALAQVALDLASAGDVGSVMQLIRAHAIDLGIPEIHLVLADIPRRRFGGGTFVAGDQSSRIQPQGLPPRSIRQREGRPAWALELLQHRGLIYGYLLIALGPSTIPLYDTIRVLVSQGIAGSLVRAPSEPGAEEGGGDAVRPVSLVAFLSSRVDRPTDLDAFARELGLSRSTLTRWARRLTGQSVQRLHEQLKIERAKLLLDDPYLNVASVASRVGFRSPLYFSRVFRRHEGLSPREWRRRGG